jgi:hypothetical protein
MRLTVISLVFTVLLQATSIPSKTYTTVVGVKGKFVTLQDSLGKNVGGIIVRRLSNGKNYITGYLKDLGNRRAQVVDRDYIGGKDLARIRPVVKVGDDVIGGFLYQKVLILAPSKDVKKRVENQFRVKSINPTYFDSYMQGKKATKRDYKNFAKMTGIGIILIVKGNSVNIYDPISLTTIKKINLN